MNMADPTESPKQWSAHVRVECRGCKRPLVANESSVIVCHNPDCPEYCKPYHVELKLTEVKVPEARN